MAQMRLSFTPTPAHPSAACVRAPACSGAPRHGSRRASTKSAASVPAMRCRLAPIIRIGCGRPTRPEHTWGKCARQYLADKVEQARHVAVAPAQQLCRLLAQLVELAHRAERERAKREKPERERARREELKVACRWRSPSSSCTARATSPMRHGYSRGPVRFATEPLSNIGAKRNLDGSVECAATCHIVLQSVYIVATAAVGIRLKSEP